MRPEEPSTAQHGNQSATGVPGVALRNGPLSLRYVPAALHAKDLQKDSRKRAHRRGFEGLSGRRPRSRARAPQRTPKRTLESDARARGPREHNVLEDQITKKNPQQYPERKTGGTVDRSTRKPECDWCPDRSHGGTGPSPLGTGRLHSAPRTSRKTPGGGRTVGASRVSQDDVGLAPKHERRGTLPSAPWRATLAQEVHERYSFGRPKVEEGRGGGEDHEGGGKRLWKVLVYGAGGPLQPQDIEGGS
ncbi:hypothetical protein IscW_ISCW020064 [Ixodes scapularis]|uniref:Uncharacterized protein n=1 Tax=Ixodes scapularis TaxID=6945 RepID=B7Q296_IXOSC|nr:hypothetical protein IscW_ISCW020064 [Ixodes scapularis]|eukprot:XP_002410589.1 hypothetical protein IscW_ISCW020064 [Ixodes scapularis]